MVELLDNHGLRVLKDVAELSVELIDLAAKYDLIDSLSGFAYVALTGIQVYDVVKKPYKIVKYTHELFTAPPSLVLIAGNIAHLVKDIFKLIAAAQGLGLLPPNICVLVGIGHLVPHIYLVVTACSIINSAVKSMKTWKSANPVVKRNLDDFQFFLNDTPQRVQESSKNQFNEIKDQVIAIYSAVAEPAPAQVSAWQSWNACTGKLNRAFATGDRGDTIEQVEFWLQNFAELALNDPISALEKESLEFGLICLYSQMEEKAADQAEKERYRNKIMALKEGKEHRIYRSRYCSLKQGIDLFAGSVAIALMLQADQSYKVFKWNELLEKTITVYGHIFN